MNRMRASITAAAAVAVFGLPVFAGTASAAPRTSPNGFIGACNMVASWPGAGPGSGVGVQPGGGMERSMTVDNPNGNAGMDRAVSATGAWGTC